MTEATRWVLHRCAARFTSAQALSLAFRLLNVALLAPLASLVLRLCLLRWGRASVGNFELLAFFLSAEGLAALLGAGTVLLATQYLELAGLIRLLAADDLHWWQAFKSSTRLFRRLVVLGLLQLLYYLVLAIPVAAAIGLTYWLLWSGKDLNGLIVLKPPVFWWGVALAGMTAAAYGLLALRMFLRWLYAVPVLIFEPNTTASQALQTSVRRSQGRLWRSAGAVGLWAAAQMLLAAAVLGIVQWTSLRLLSRTASSLSAAVLVSAVVLAINAVVATLLSVVANITLAGVVLWLYRQAAPVPSQVVESQASHSKSAGQSPGWMLAGSLAAVAALAATFSVQLLRQVKLEDHVEITAHRAGAAHAPENSLAALRLAIADGADWAEIDVQLTSDQGLVVLHDIDLARVGGGNRRVDRTTLAEIQALDIGSAFGPQFAGERIATLGDFLGLAGDSIRLNVELKPHNSLDGQVLTRRVIDSVRQAGMLDRCRLCSQSYECLQLAREEEPRLQIGYIVATAIGDPAGLDVDFLMVRSDFVTRALTDRAGRRRIAVHAWTVNDFKLVGPLLDAGVANLITDDPARMRAELDDIQALNTVDRLLLRVQNAIQP